jgi:hypothetical protein
MKFHVPGRAPELSVGGALQADVLLHAHDVADGVVLHRAQLFGAHGAVGMGGSGGQHALRPEQAADVVGAERGFLARVTSRP